MLIASGVVWPIVDCRLRIADCRWPCFCVSLVPFDLPCAQQPGAFGFEVRRRVRISFCHLVGVETEGREGLAGWRERSDGLIGREQLIE